MTRQSYLEMVVVTLLVAITTCLLVYATNSSDHNLHAQTTAIDNKTLFVTGSATTQTKPDKVTVSLGVETTNAKAKTALATNSELMNKIINALKIAGVSENETSTSSFTITPNRDYTIDKDQGKLPEPGTPVDEAWKQMQVLLVKNNLTVQEKKNKRRTILLVLLFLFISITGTILYSLHSHDHAIKIVTAGSSNKKIQKPNTKN